MVRRAKNEKLGQSIGELELRQAEADAWIESSKKFVHAETILFRPGSETRYELKQLLGAERFVLVLLQSKMKPGHAKFCLMARKGIQLVRLEINAERHRNPDRTFVGGTHIHRFREGFADGVAAEIGAELGPRPDPVASFAWFLRYCNVVHQPDIYRAKGLFDGREKDDLIAAYFDWLRRESQTTRLDGGWTELSIPFLDRHNDFLSVYVRQNKGGIEITDAGETAQDLRISGCDLKASGRRQELADQALRKLGAKWATAEDQAISSHAANGDFPNCLHGVLFSMLAVDGLAHLSHNVAASQFEDDVDRWLSGSGLDYKKGIDLPGKSTTRHKFDFLVHPPKGMRDIVLHSVPVPDKLHLESFMYQVIDTKAGMGDASPDFYGILNDRTAGHRKQYRDMLEYGISPLRWTKRDQLVKRLTTSN